VRAYPRETQEMVFDAHDRAFALFNRQMVGILTAVLTDGLPAVEVACAEAIAHGVHSADVILNIQVRQRDPEPPITILRQPALTPRHAPIADCARYDSPRRII
jgi:hypothetical protein